MYNVQASLDIISEACELYKIKSELILFTQIIHSVSKALHDYRGDNVQSNSTES